MHAKLLYLRGHIRHGVHFVTWLPWLNAKWQVPPITNGAWVQRDALIEARWTYRRGKRLAGQRRGGMLRTDLPSVALIQT